MGLDTELEQVCRRVALSTWRRVRSMAPASFDADDLTQEALLAGWTWQCKHAEDVALGYAPNLLNPAGRYVSYRLIDRMRALNPVGRDGNRRSAPVSLDDPGSADDQRTLADFLPDPITQDALDDIEMTVDLELAFRSYPGPARHADVAFLHARGVSFAEIGEHYGFTPAHASHLRTAFVRRIAQHWATAGRQAPAA